MRVIAMHALTFAAAAATMLATGAPVRASDSDDKIESSFKKTYVAMTYLKHDSVTPKAKDGVVTLTGTVSDPGRKALAQETAAGLPGVKRVDNQLVTAAQVQSDNADSWIDRKVKLTLLFHRNVNASGTSVAVKEGVVTLGGEASSKAQKELTAEYASDIDGVREVRNEMTVASNPKPSRTAGEKLDDASITAQVRAALSTHRSTSNLKTKVETRNGEVTLTGIARNAAEKDLVTKLVSDIQGVTSSKNLMTLDETKTR